MPGFAAGDQVTLLADEPQQLHLPVAALASGHRMLRVVAFAPRRGSRGVDKPATVRMRLQLCRNPLPRVVDGLPVAEDSAGIPLPVLAPYAPTALPIAVGVQGKILGPGLGRPIGMHTAQLGEILRIHHVLVDVVAAAEHAHLVQLPQRLRRAAIAPQDPIDAQRLQLATDAHGALVPAPYVDRPDQQVDVRVGLAFLCQRSEQSGLFGVLAVPFAHRHVAASV